jgi:hypothetical protein
MCTYIAGKKRHWKSIGYLKPPKFKTPKTDNWCSCIARTSVAVGVRLMEVPRYHGDGGRAFYIEVITII